MSKFYTYTLVLLSLAACSNVEDKIEGYKFSEIVVVTLDVEKTEGIEKIVLTTDINRRDSILKQDMKGRYFKLKYPCRGESGFNVCVYTNSDTLCSGGGYAEGGYRPRLSFKNNTFKTISFH